VRRSVRALVLLVGSAVLACGCADRGSPGAPSEEDPPVVLQPMPPAPGPFPDDGLLPEGELSPEERGVDPMPYEQFTFAERLHALAGDSPDFGVLDARDRAVLVVRWFGEPPPAVGALVEEYADAPFDIRVQPTRFRPGDLRAEAQRLIEQHPGVVTATFPRNEGDGVGLGIDPSVAASPDQADLERLGVTSRFPLFPEALGPAVPAAGAASG
jgi:hypothetical protein